MVCDLLLDDTEFRRVAHTLRLCWASGVNALISHRIHRNHRLLVFFNNAGF